MPKKVVPGPYFSHLVMGRVGPWVGPDIIISYIKDLILQFKMLLLQIRKLLSFLNDSKGGVSLGTITLNKLFNCKSKNI